MTEVISNDIEVNVSEDEQYIGKLAISDTVLVADMVIITPAFANVELPGRRLVS